MASPLKGKAAVIGASVVLVGCLVFLLSWLFSSTEADQAGNRVFICKDTMKEFRHSIVKGETLPIMSPYTKQRTGYPAEECYWEKDPSKPGGYRAKVKPTYVLLNTFKNPDDKTPTICPDCGKTVVPHNASVNMPPRNLRDEAKKR